MICLKIIGLFLCHRFDLHRYSIILSRGARRRNYQISSAFRSYFPMFSPLLFILVKKNEIMFYSVSFCPLNSPKSITSHLILLIQFYWLLSQLRKLGMGCRQFHAGKAKEATSEMHEKLKGADESYWTVFPVKFTEQF